MLLPNELGLRLGTILPRIGRGSQSALGRWEAGRRRGNRRVASSVTRKDQGSQGTEPGVPLALMRVRSTRGEEAAAALLGVGKLNRVGSPSGLLTRG